MYDKQLNLTRSSIKNKLFEIAKNLKNLNFNKIYEKDLLKITTFQKQNICRTMVQSRKNRI